MKDKRGLTPPRDPIREDFFERYEQDPESVRTAALAANASEVVQNTQGFAAQQHDRHVVGITSDATGAARDRHGRTFAVRDMIESSGRQSVTIKDESPDRSLSVRRGMSR